MDIREYCDRGGVSHVPEVIGGRHHVLPKKIEWLYVRLDHGRHLVVQLVNVVRSFRALFSPPPLKNKNENPTSITLCCVTRHI
ncbi:hypothetical protein V5799_031078 [Amblyomma americanum]|uniref:Uncharacterized protein n=1 Tax=Amblyomma americanum TaxID=6943 RepID=A0AAQ4EL96_AMBAM